MVSSSVLLAAAIVVIEAVLGADGTPTSREQSVALGTTYLIQPIAFEIDGRTRQVHRIQLTGAVGGEASLTLDGNACDVDDFGDTLSCTQARYSPLKVTLVELPSAHLAKEGRRLLEIRGAKIDRGIRIVVPDAAGKLWPRFIVLSVDGKKTDYVFTAEPMP